MTLASAQASVATTPALRSTACRTAAWPVESSGEKLSRWTARRRPLSRFWKQCELGEQRLRIIFSQTPKLEIHELQPLLSAFELLLRIATAVVLEPGEIDVELSIEAHQIPM